MSHASEEGHWRTDSRDAGVNVGDQFGGDGHRPGTNQGSQGGRKHTDLRGMLGGKVTGLVILRYSTVLCRDAVPQC